MTAGWWRRNWWGLLLLVPALALAFVPPLRDTYHQFRRSQFTTPISGSPGGWVGFAGARMRLAGLAVDGGLRDFSGKPLDLPDGVRAWRATIDFDAPDQHGLLGCEIDLEATDGTTFASDPDELDGFDVPIADCTPDDTSDTPPARYQTVAYFVLPPSAKPAGLRITTATKLPTYARLTLG